MFIFVALPSPGRPKGGRLIGVLLAVINRQQVRQAWPLNRWPIRRGSRPITKSVWFWQTFEEEKKEDEIDDDDDDNEDTDEIADIKANGECHCFDFHLHSCTIVWYRG